MCVWSVVLLSPLRVSVVPPVQLIALISVSDFSRSSESRSSSFLFALSGFSAKIIPACACCALTEGEISPRGTVSTFLTCVVVFACVSSSERRRPRLSPGLAWLHGGSRAQPGAGSAAPVPLWILGVSIHLLKTISIHKQA